MDVLKFAGLFLSLSTLILLNIDPTLSDEMDKEKIVSDSELFLLQKRSFADSLGYGYLQSKQSFNKLLDNEQGGNKWSHEIIINKEVPNSE